MKNLNVFIIESPLQALMMIEAISAYPSGKSVALVKYAIDSRERNNKQLDGILSKLHSNIEVLKFTESNAGVLSIHFKRARNLKKLVAYKKSGFTIRLFIGDFRSEWMHFSRVLLEPNKTILLDDGAATLTCYTRFLANNIVWPTRFIDKGLKFLLVSWMYVGNPFLCIDKYPREIGLFTTFNLKSTKTLTVKENDFRVLRSNLSNRDLASYAMHVGSKYSESDILSLNNEIYCLKRIKKYYDQEGVDRVYYVVHRDESAQKVNLIFSELGFYPLYLDEPLEISLVNSTEHPRYLSGLYSTAIFNVNMLLPSVKSLLFKPPIEIFDVKHRENVDGVYNFAEASGIDIIQIERLSLVSGS